MARKPVGPMDINEYYRTMGARPESDEWDMPLYNATNGKPITGSGREAPHSSGTFHAPAYNREGKPVLSGNSANGSQAGSSAFQLEVFRPGTLPGRLFDAPAYNDASGKPVLNDSPTGVPEGGVYRPSQVKAKGVATPAARSESGVLFGENRHLYLNNGFSADVLGTPLPLGSFSRISGLEVEWELETYREGGDNSGDHFFPRQIKNSRIVFESGTGKLEPLQKWFTLTQQGMMVKLPMLIYLLDAQKKPQKIWMLLDALPVKYSVSDFDAMASDVVITRLEFIHNGLVGIL